MVPRLTTRFIGPAEWGPLHRNIGHVPDKSEGGQADHRRGQPHGYGDETTGEPEEQGADNQHGRMDGDCPSGVPLAFRTSCDDLIILYYIAFSTAAASSPSFNSDSSDRPEQRQQQASASTGA